MNPDQKPETKSTWPTLRILGYVHYLCKLLTYGH